MAVTTQAFAPGRRARRPSDTTVIPIDGIDGGTSTSLARSTNVTIIEHADVRDGPLQGRRALHHRQRRLHACRERCRRAIARASRSSAADERRRRPRPSATRRRSPTGCRWTTLASQKADNKFAKDFAKARKEERLRDGDRRRQRRSHRRPVHHRREQRGERQRAGAGRLQPARRSPEAGKKSDEVGKCYATSAKKGTAPDETCVQKAADQFVRALKKCSTAEQSMPLETIVDNFARNMSRAVAVPSTTTTTTTTSHDHHHGARRSACTTRSPARRARRTARRPTIPARPLAPLLGRRSYSDIDRRRRSDRPRPGLPLHRWRGRQRRALQLPENAKPSSTTPDAQTLLASFGTGSARLHEGSGARRAHCLNNSRGRMHQRRRLLPRRRVSAGRQLLLRAAGSRQRVPGELRRQHLRGRRERHDRLWHSSATLNVQLASRVYISTLNPTACPQCIDNTCTFGQNPGGFCQTNNINLTTLDCLAERGHLHRHAAHQPEPAHHQRDGDHGGGRQLLSRPGHAGCVREPRRQAIRQQGSINIATGEATLVSNFCIPSTGSASLDNIANLPGPGTLSLPGVTVFSSPSGAFLE